MPKSRRAGRQAARRVRPGSAVPLLLAAALLLATLLTVSLARAQAGGATLTVTLGGSGYLLTDASGRSQVVLSGLRYNRVRRAFQGFAQVTAAGAEVLAAPLVLVVDQISDPAASLANGDGLTSDGRPFIDLTPYTGGAGLAPGGATGRIPLVFQSGGRRRFTFRATVYAPVSNRPPVADAGADQTVVAGDGVQLDGGSSSDPDGDPITFTWSVVSAPAGSVAALSDPASATPTFTPDVAGTYQLQLVVSDGTLDSTPATVSIQATPPDVDADGDGFTVGQGDCNDADPAIHPGAVEVCNRADDDCDGQVDEGVTATFFADTDGDGFGTPETTSAACTPPGGFVTNDQDCDDTDPAIHPGAREILDNGIDEDCDGVDGLSKLTLSVVPPHSPTFQTSQVITGTVGAASGASETPPPLVAALTTTEGRQGATLDVGITGENTDFQPNVTQVSFGSGITVNRVTVEGPARVTANISIAEDATLGPRVVAASTGRQEAILGNAFNVLPGLGSATGKLVDPEGTAIAGAQVCVAGTTQCSTTGADGSFTLTGVSSTATRLSIQASGYEPISVGFGVPVGGAVPLGAIPIPRSQSPPPPQPPGVPAISPQLASILGRGATEIAPALPISGLKKLIRDTIIELGGSEAGVLDENGQQLNPEVNGDGIVSLRDSGVEQLALRLAAGDTTPLGVLFAMFIDSFDYSSGDVPLMSDILAGLQQEVDDAWADPTAPGAELMITLFNQGRTISATPPQIGLDTPLNSNQSYLLLTSLITYVVEVVTGGAPAIVGLQGPFLAANMQPPSRMTDAGSLLLLAQNTSQSQSQTAPTKKKFSYPWIDLFGKVEFSFSTDISEGKTSFGNGGDIFSILLTNNKNIRLQAANAFTDHFFPGEISKSARIRMKQTFESEGFQKGYSFARSQALSLGMDRLSKFTSFASDFVNGFVQNIVGDAFTTLITDPLIGRLIQLIRPEPPYIRDVVQLVDPETGLQSNVVAIFFDRVMSDKEENKGEGKHFKYEVFRKIRSGIVKIACCRVRNTTKDGGHGPLLAKNVPNIHEIAPRVQINDRTLVVFDMPPEGYIQYRTRVTRIIARKPLVAAAPSNLMITMNTLLSPVSTTVGNTSFSLGILSRILSPIEKFLKGIQLQRSDFSPAFGTAIIYSSPPPPLPSNLAVDPSGDGVCVSVPSLNRILRFRTSGSGFVAEPFADANFKEPHQIGLAVDWKGNYYTDNHASDTRFGGRLFSFNPLGGRTFVGSVNYFSPFLMYARPTSVQYMVTGPSPSGEALYIADASEMRITRLFPLFLPPGFDRNVSQPFARSALFAFRANTTMAFRGDGRLFVNQGPEILEVYKEGQEVRELFDPVTAPTPYVNTSGLAFDPDGNLYVSDLGDSMPGSGSISMVPLELQDPGHGLEGLSRVGRKKLVVEQGMSSPEEIKIAVDGKGLFFTDRNHVIRYLAFGMSGQVVDRDGNPVSGAQVIAETVGGAKEVRITDADGVYVLPGLQEGGVSTVLDVTIRKDGRADTRRVILNPVGHSVRDFVFDPKPDLPVTSPGQPRDLQMQVTITGPVVPPRSIPTECPRARFLVPADGTVTTASQITVRGFLTDHSIVEATLLVNGVPQGTVTVTDGVFQTTAALSEGNNVLAIAVRRSLLTAAGCRGPGEEVPVLIPEVSHVYLASDPTTMAQLQQQRGFDRVVTGTVLDRDTSDPVVGVRFRVPGTPYEALSDLDGVFQLRLQVTGLRAQVDSVLATMRAIRETLQQVIALLDGADLDGATSAFPDLLLQVQGVLDHPPVIVSSANTYLQLLDDIDSTSSTIVRTIQQGGAPAPGDVELLRQIETQLTQLNQTREVVIVSEDDPGLSISVNLN